MIQHGAGRHPHSARVASNKTDWHVSDFGSLPLTVIITVSSNGFKCLPRDTTQSAVLLRQVVRLFVRLSVTMSIVIT